MQVQGQLSNSTLTLHEVQALQLKAHSLLCTNKTSKTAHDHTVSWVQAPSAAVAAEGDGEMRVRAARVTHCAAGRDGAEADPVRRGVRAGAAQQPPGRRVRHRRPRPPRPLGGPPEASHSVCKAVVLTWREPARGTCSPPPGRK